MLVPTKLFESTHVEHVRYDVWKLMANITVNVPESLKKKMEQVPDVNWSKVAREAFEETIRPETDARRGRSNGQTQRIRKGARLERGT